MTVPDRTGQSQMGIFLATCQSVAFASLLLGCGLAAA